MQVPFWLVLAAILGLALYAGVKGRKQAWALFYGPLVREAVDFETLELGPKPNQYLVCPSGLCGNAAPHAPAPVFDLTPGQLRERWMERIAALPRVELLEARSDTLSFEVLTPLMGFPDTVDVRILPAGDARSTLAIYSRSHYGYSDLGANEKRIKDWLERLGR